ncbi:MAG: hypothetical protein H7Y02_03900, partial [Candidatus Obscuribacterales bacterium]|nr:hypothetical protein [Steroidobacteraceae bacterium]
MKVSLKRIIAACAVAAAAATPAFAFDPASGGTGNSSLVIAVFDPTLGVSVFQDLGLNYLDWQNSTVSRDGSAGIDVTPDAGYTANFAVNMSVFTTAGSSTSNLRWNVFAADAQGAFSATETLVTADVTLGTIPGTNSDVTAISGPNAYSNIIGQCASQAMTTVCTGTTSPATGVVVAGTNWGEYMQFLDVSAS